MVPQEVEIWEIWGHHAEFGVQLRPYSLQLLDLGRFLLGFP